jgi:disulfide bond formation protein DsbB
MHKKQFFIRRLLSFKSDYAHLLLWISFVSILQLFIALYAQHHDGADPCRLCVLIRADVIIIAITSAAAFIGRRSLQIRTIMVFCSLIASLFGLTHAFSLLIEEGMFKGLETSSGCVFSSVFPSWAPLDTLLPYVFEPRAICGDSQWIVLGVPSSVLTFIIFSAYIIAFCYGIYLSFKKPHSSHIDPNSGTPTSARLS